MPSEVTSSGIGAFVEGRRVVDGRSAGRHTPESESIQTYARRSARQTAQTPGVGLKVLALLKKTAPGTMGVMQRYFD